MQVWNPEEGKPALKLQWNLFGVLICLSYLAATGYYFYVRCAFTMALGSTSWWVAIEIHASLTYHLISTVAWDAISPGDIALHVIIISASQSCWCDGECSEVG